MFANSIVTLLVALVALSVNAQKNDTVVANTTVSVVTSLPPPTNITTTSNVTTTNETIPVNKTEEVPVPVETVPEVDPDHEDKSFYPGSDDEDEAGDFTIVDVDAIAEEDEVPMGFVSGIFDKVIKAYHSFFLSLNKEIQAIEHTLGGMMDVSTVAHKALAFVLDKFDWHIFHLMRGWIIWLKTKILGSAPEFKFDQSVFAD